MKKLLLATTFLFPSLAFAGGADRPNNTYGWSLFGITIPYHDEVCTYQYADFYYPDLCGQRRGDEKSPVKGEAPSKPIDVPSKPPKEEDNNGGDTKEEDNVGGTDPGDFNGGDTKDTSDSNGGDSSDDSNGDNSDDNGGKSHDKKGRK